MRSPPNDFELSWIGGTVVDNASEVTIKAQVPVAIVLHWSVALIGTQGLTRAARVVRGPRVARFSF